ncbi:jg6057, partial [Pararge aegeria aegeria]
TYNANIDNIDKEEDKNQTDQDDVVYVDSEKEVVLIDDDEEQEAEGKANNDTNAAPDRVRSSAPLTIRYVCFKQLNITCFNGEGKQREQISREDLKD